MIGYGNSMFLATHGILARGASGAAVDPDAQAFITAAAITDPTQQAAINTLVVDLKGYNVWTKMKAVYPFVGVTATTHKWNLKDPRDLDAAFRLQFINGWTHSANGATPNGTDGYADTKLVPSTALSFANTHLSIYSRTDSVKDAWNGSSGTSFLPIIGLLLKSSDPTSKLLFDSYDYLLTGNRMSITNTDSRGHFIGNVYSNTSQKVYKNGSIFGTNTNTQTQTTLPAYSIFLSGRNDVGTTSSFDNKQLAFASIGDGLTDTESANFYTAVQAFQTTLGRQV